MIVQQVDEHCRNVLLQNSIIYMETNKSENELKSNFNL